jgi:GT2 family glycosyltransferase
MLLSIITLNFKKPHLTLACLESLYEQYGEEFEKGVFELIIVDNFSGDESVAKLRHATSSKQHVKIIANTENSGFSKGCNLGASSAKGKYILFLNNDTVVKDKGLLAMVEYMEEHTEAAILGGQLRNADGSLQPSAGEFYTPVYAFALLLGLQKFGLVDKNPEKIAQVSWVKGGLFMIQSEVFKKLGGFDENIFMYTEDMELCYRARLAGYKTYFYPHVTIYHADQGSSNRSFAIVHIYKNLLYFYKKHRSHGEYLLIKSLMRAKAEMLMGVGKITGNRYLEETYREAIKGVRG